MQTSENQAASSEARPSVNSEKRFGVWPGILLAFGLALFAQHLARWIGAWVLTLQGLDPAGKASPVSGISVAVLLGILGANLLPLPRVLAPGLAFAVKKVLRWGIVLVGLKLSLLDVLRVGSLGIPVVAVLVAVALVLSLGIARWAKVSPTLGTLAAASTAICGITATLAIAPSVEADEREVAYTVANVTLFGLFGMLVYPYLAHALFGGAPGSAGLFLGTAIHDTSQVMGAALSYRELFGDERALEVATIAKLLRNAFLVAVVPALAFMHSRRAGAAAGRPPLASLFPRFVLAFLAMAALRTLGDWGLETKGVALGLLEAAQWEGAIRFLGETVSVLALGTALAAVGLTTRLAALRDLGLRPMGVGFGAAAGVGVAAAIAAHLAGPLLG